MKKQYSKLPLIILLLFVFSQELYAQSNELFGIWIGDKIIRKEKQDSDIDKSTSPPLFNLGVRKTGFYISINDKNSVQWTKFYQEKDTTFKIQGDSLIINDVPHFMDKSKLPDSLFLDSETERVKSTITLYKGILNSPPRPPHELYGHNFKIFHNGFGVNPFYEIYFSDTSQHLFFTDNGYTIPTNTAFVEYYKTEINDEIFISFYNPHSMEGVQLILPVNWRKDSLAIVSNDLFKLMNEKVSFEYTDRNKPSVAIEDSIDLTGYWVAKTYYKGIFDTDTLRDSCYYVHKLELLSNSSYNLKQTTFNQNGVPIDSLVQSNTWRLIYNAILEINEVRHQYDVRFYYQIRNYGANNFTINRNLLVPYSKNGSQAQTLIFTRKE
jgi:hypothetical protein